MSHTRLLVPLVLTLCLVAGAKNKDKKKITLPSDVLQAHTVFVEIQPDAGEPLTDPTANRRALEDVERALMQWHRFDVVMEASSADLVIAVRKGNGQTARPTIHGPLDDRPVIVEPTDGDVRVGGRQGRPPDITQPNGLPNDSSPRIANEVGPSEDTFEVYRGRVGNPLDAPPVWRYMAKDALSAPAVPAVVQFRKAIDEAQKAAQKTQP